MWNQSPIVGTFTNPCHVWSRNPIIYQKRIRMYAIYGNIYHQYTPNVTWWFIPLSKWVSSPQLCLWTLPPPIPLKSPGLFHPQKRWTWDEPPSSIVAYTPYMDPSWDMITIVIINPSPRLEPWALGPSGSSLRKAARALATSRRTFLELTGSSCSHLEASPKVGILRQFKVLETTWSSDSNMLLWLFQNPIHGGAPSRLCLLVYKPK